MIISSFIMITINKAKEIAKYVSDFASSRFEDIDIFIGQRIGIGIMEYIS